MSVSIVSGCDGAEFLQAVRLDGLLKFNLERTEGRLKVPDREIVHVARDEYGVIVGGVSGSTCLSTVEVEVLWV